MLASIFSDVVNVRRRPLNPPVDVLNNFNYGSPETWPLAYQNVKVRLAWSGKALEYKNTGELVYPTGTLYYSKSLTLQPMDRIVTAATAGIPIGIEYIVEAVYPSYIISGVVDHMEANVRLPV